MHARLERRRFQGAAAFGLEVHRAHDRILRVFQPPDVRELESASLHIHVHRLRRQVIAPVTRDAPTVHSEN